MSKLNPPNTQILSKKAPHGLGVSANGNLQVKKGPEHELFELLVSSLYGNDSYYETSNEKTKRMIAALEKVVSVHGTKGAMFAARSALFARQKMFIRTMPIVMVVELARILHVSKTNFLGMREFVFSIIQRADELTDLYAYAISVFKEKNHIPIAIKKGVADAFNKFDTYQMGKYNHKDGKVTFPRLLRIVHPTPIDEERAMIFDKLIKNQLESPLTWEVELTKNGQLPAIEQKTKKQIWTEFILREGSGSLGYMALIRNLRNMKEAGIDDSTWKVVADRIQNPIAVEKSKQLPFGFINAYEIAKDSGIPTIVINALSIATEISIGNMPKVGDRVWIILDCSGSMNHSSYMTNNSPIKVGAIFASALFKAANESFECKMTMFDDHAKFVELSTQDSIFTNYSKIMARNAGGGTNLQSAFDQKKRLGFEPDTVFVISDMQVNNLRSHDSTNIFGKDCVKVAINLNSGSTTPISEWQGWTQVYGWSEKIFQFIKFSRDADSIVDRIMKNEELTDV